MEAGGHFDRPPDIEALPTPVSPKTLVRVVDYLLITTHSEAGATPAGRDGPVELPEGIRIECLEQETWERLITAAEPRGENWCPSRQFHVVHAYVRTAWQEGAEVPEGLYEWDSGRRLYPCIQLSRFIHDNNAGTEFAVRRLVRADGSETLIPFTGFGSHVAYRLYPGSPEWLSTDQVDELANLLDCFWNGPERPERVGRALRRADLVTAERYLEDALPVVVGGLESLVCVGRDWVTAQFAQRVPQLAAEAGVEGLDEQTCRELYRDRSALVHGTEVDLSQPQTFDRFGRGFVALQETLRRTVRRAIEDEQFAAQFADDEQIKATWVATVELRGESVAV